MCVIPPRMTYLLESAEAGGYDFIVATDALFSVERVNQCPNH